MLKRIQFKSFLVLFCLCTAMNLVISRLVNGSSDVVFCIVALVANCVLLHFWDRKFPLTVD